MQMVESQFEIDHIPESVCLPFEGFDLVVCALDNRTGDRVFEVAEKPCFVAGQGLGHPAKGSDAALPGIFDPDIEKAPGTLQIPVLPKEPELLLHRMGDEKGMIGLKQLGFLSCPFFFYSPQVLICRMIQISWLAEPVELGRMPEIVT